MYLMIVFQIKCIVQYISVFNKNTFRYSRRTGGIYNIAQVISCYFNRGSSVIFFRKKYFNRFRIYFKYSTRILSDIFSSFFRYFSIKRKISTACFQHTQKSNNNIACSWKSDNNNIRYRHSPYDKCICNSV